MGDVGRLVLLGTAHSTFQNETDQWQDRIDLVLQVPNEYKAKKKGL